MATQTRNHRLAATAEIAAKVLWRYPNLPRAASVALTDVRVAEYTYEPAVKLLVDDPHVTGVAQWAEEFGSPVRFTEHSYYVELSTEAVVDGVRVVAWHHLPHSKAWQLALALGLKSVSDMAEVEPARLLMLGGES